MLPAYIKRARPGTSTAAADRGQLGVFMVLVFGAIALVVVSIVLLLGMQIAGGFTPTGDAFTQNETFTAGSDGNFVYEVNRTPSDRDVIELDPSVTVTNHSSGSTLTEGTDYEWDPDTGELTLLSANATTNYSVAYSGSESTYANAVTSTEDSTGDSFELFGTSVLVIPAAAVLAVLIGGLVGAISMGGSLPGMGGNGGRRGRGR